MVRPKTAGQHGDVAQLEEHLLCKSLDSCAVLTYRNTGSCAPKTDQSGALAYALLGASPTGGRSYVQPVPRTSASTLAGRLAGRGDAGTPAALSLPFIDLAITPMPP